MNRLNKLALLNLVGFVCCIVLMGCGGGGGVNTQQETTYTITAAPGAGGELVVQNTKPQKGSQVVATAIPSAGYGVDSFSGCGGGTTDYATYTTSPVTANCTLTVTFKKVAAVEGIVADGAPLNSVPVIARCADGTGFSAKVTTDSEGKFTGYVGESAFPCALKATGLASKTYYSLVQAPGTANITLLTDMVLTLASGASAADWYASSDWKSVLAELPESFEDVEEALFDKGYDLPTGEFQPFNLRYVRGDVWDALLRQLNDGIGASDLKSYSALAATIKTAGISKLPTPTGAAEVSAEMCFKPVFYADGTTWKYRLYEPETTWNGKVYPASERTFELLSQTTAAENGVLVQTQIYAQVLKSTSTDTGLPFEAPMEYVEKRIVDYASKTITKLGINGRSTKSSYSYKTERTGQELWRFNLTKGETYKNIFSDVVWSSNKAEPTTTDFEITITFNGLSRITRNGTEYRVCDFTQQLTRTDDSPIFGKSTRTVDPMTIYVTTQDGVFWDSPFLTSYQLNNKELF